MDVGAVIILVSEAAFALYLLKRERLLRSPYNIAFALFFTALAFVSRALVLDYVTLDYSDFLARWVDYFRQNGGFAALRTQIGNYNIPYLYFLALFSYSSIDDLYLIKLLSIFFDVLLAWGAMLIVSRFTASVPRRMGVFFTVLMLPTVFLNGALWGQCDSIYVSLALLGIYCALDDRPVLSIVLAALSFSFKLQAVFILPVYIVLWIYGKFSWKHFFIFPLTYVLVVMPVVLLGRPFIDTLSIYFDQAGTVGSGLNYNSPSVYSFFQYSLPEEYSTIASNLGVIFAFIFMFGVLLACFLRKERLNELAVLTAAALLVIGIPYLLPHMHERYFFAADILSVVIAFIVPPFAALPLLVQFASLLGYHAYLKMKFLLLMDRGAGALAFAIFMLLVLFFSASRHAEKRKN